MQSFSVFYMASLLVVANSKVLKMTKSEVQMVDGLDQKPNNNTVHFFVLMVPDSNLQDLYKGRQEEEAITLTETGTYVGQIISGVLGGDVRPIFAGSVSFIGEQDVQQGVGTILANVANPLTKFVQGWFNRAQTFLGITTTPRPGQIIFNQTAPAGRPYRPSYGTIAGQPEQLSPVQLALLQQQLASIQQQNRPQPVPGSTVNFYEATTVAQLPFIKLRPDEDDDESDLVNKFVKI